ncbi:hypothetical protein JOC34_001471 [Virgibacillus halotolerans]|nr:hypothetical protein [Virgibacillus halotolerans]
MMKVLLMQTMQLGIYEKALLLFTFKAFSLQG